MLTASRRRVLLAGACLVAGAMPLPRSGAALAKGNFATGPVHLPELKINTVDLKFSETSYALETGKFYWWKISCDGEEEDIAFMAPSLFAASWVYQVVSGDDSQNEVHTQALTSVEFDGEGTMTIQFVPLMPGKYDYYCAGYETRGLKGSVVVN